jgi:hypothetical protein
MERSPRGQALIVVHGALVLVALHAIAAGDDDEGATGVGAAAIYAALAASAAMGAAGRAREAALVDALAALALIVFGAVIRSATTDWGSLWFVNVALSAAALAALACLGLLVASLAERLRRR